MESEAIEFLLFTVKQTQKSIVDVTIDLKAREYKIETTDLYGQTLKPEEGGRLRRKKVAAFSETLAELDLISYPRKDKNTLPIHLDSATLMYVIDDKTYYTDGNPEYRLSRLHKEIEQLIGTTFGSYAFY